MGHLMDAAIVMTSVPTYQPEVVLQHLEWNHGCISHTTETAFVRTCETYTQRREVERSRHHTSYRERNRTLVDF